MKILKTAVGNAVTVKVAGSITTDNYLEFQDFLSGFDYSRA